MAIFRYQHGDTPLEGFTIQYGLGRGGFGEVYYALSDSGREVALKAVQNYEDIELRGIRHCMNLKHQQLVSIHDIKHSAEGLPFVVMEFVDGPSLRDIMDSHPEGLGSAKAAFFLQQIAKGISYLHDCGVVHRDLKPHNVFYENGTVKIGDYSLSKSISTSHRSGHTMTVGTVHYMAPEIGLGRYDHTVDIYALGVLLYEMVTGHPPFLGQTMGEVLMKHVSGEVDVSGLDKPFAKVVKRALAKDPDDRYQTAKEMVDDLMGHADLQNSVASLGPESLTIIAEKATRKATEEPAVAQTSEPADIGPGNQATASFQKPKVATPPSDLHAKSSWRGSVMALVVVAIIAFIAFLFMTKAGGGLNGRGIFAVFCAGAAIFFFLRQRHVNQIKESKRKAGISPDPNVPKNSVLPTAVVTGTVAVITWAIAMSVGPSPPGYVLVFTSFVCGGISAISLLVGFARWVSRKDQTNTANGTNRAKHATPQANNFSQSTAEPILYAAVAKPVVAQHVEPPKSRPVPPPHMANQYNPGYGPHPHASPSSRFVALCMSLPLFLGIPVAGLQRIYVGRIKTGILWLVTFGLFGFGQLYDVIMIAVGHFKDADGRRVLAFSKENLNQMVRQPVNQYSHVMKRNWTDSRIGFRLGNLVLNLAGGLLLIVALITGAARTIDIPAAAANGVFGTELQSDLIREFEIRDWDTIVSLVLTLVSVTSGSLAAVALIFARRESTWKHMSRVVFSAVLFLASLISLGAASQMGKRWDYIGTLVQDGLVGEAVKQTLPTMTPALLFGSLFFVGGMFLLAWPAKQQERVEKQPKSKKQQEAKQTVAV